MSSHVREAPSAASGPKPSSNTRTGSAPARSGPARDDPPRPGSARDRAVSGQARRAPTPAGSGLHDHSPPDRRRTLRPAGGSSVGSSRRELPESPRRGPRRSPQARTPGGNPGSAGPRFRRRRPTGTSSLRSTAPSCSVRRPSATRPPVARAAGSSCSAGRCEWVTAARAADQVFLVPRAQGRVAGAPRAYPPAPPRRTTTPIARTSRSWTAATRSMERPYPHAPRTDRPARLRAAPR